MCTFYRLAFAKLLLMVSALSSHKDAENISDDKNFKWLDYNKNEEGEDLTAQEVCNKLWNDMLLQSTTWCAVDSNNLRSKTCLASQFLLVGLSTSTYNLTLCNSMNLLLK